MKHLISNDHHSKQTLSHHRLRVYWRALRLAKWVADNPIERSTLRSQATRAAESVALNVAEAAGLDGKRNKAQFRIARGSTLEVVAAYELAVACGEEHTLSELLADARAVASMLTKLGR